MTMKRALLSVAMAGIVGLTAPTPASAQWVLGAQGGLASFKVSGDSPDKASYGSQVRMSAAGVFGYRFSPALVIKIEPGIIQKGSAVSYDVSGVEEPVDSLSLNLTYVSVPLVAQVYTRGGRGYAVAGLDFGYLSSGALVANESGQEEDVKDLLESTDISWLFGAGGVVYRGGLDVNLELRYSQSLMKVFEGTGSSDPKSLPLGFRSSGFQLMAGVAWYLGGGR